MSLRLNDSTVLIVEDEPMLLEVTSHWFERIGCRVLTAENGALALEAVESHSVNLIVTDIRMPEVDGLTFLRKMKARGVYTPSIVFISSGSDVSPRDACDLGIEATFSKPVARPLLIAAAERILTKDVSQWNGRSIGQSIGPSNGPWHGEQGPLLSGTFGSLAAALRMGQIAFGKGGFCVETGKRWLEGPVQFDIDFVGDACKLSGHGFVRWSAPQERKAGVEIAYLEKISRDWVADQTALNATVSFIPRTGTGAAPVNAGLFFGDPGNASHELRNLLAVVIAYSEACQLLKPEEPVRHYVEQMQLCAQRAVLLVSETSISPASISASAIQDPQTRVADRKAP
jgi:CheY-like chemotaxis protein